MRPFLWLALAGALLAASCTIPTTGLIALDDQAMVESGGQVTIPVLLNDRPPPGESLTIVRTQGGRGSVLRQDDGTLLYTAPAGFGGEYDRFSYLVRSDTSRPVEALVVVFVAPPTPGEPSLAPPTPGEPPLAPPTPGEPPLAPPTPGEPPLVIEIMEIIETSLVDFGGVDVDGEAFREVRVTNAGPGPIPVGAPFIEPGGSPSFEVVGFDCGRDLEKGESCGVVLAFRPADAGLHSASLALGDGHRIDMRGVGIGSGENPGLQPEPSFVEFGRVDVGGEAVRVKEVRFTNPGPGSIGVEGPIIERGTSTDFHIDDSDCRDDIAAGASCVVAVAFRPINQGSHSAVLALGGGARVELHGTGIGISADLVVTYSPSRDAVAAGQTLIYEIIVHNHGPDPASNVTVSATLPNEVTLVRVSSTQGSCTIIPCKLGTLNSGASATVLVEVEVNGGALDGAVLTSTASVDSDVIDPSRANNTMSARTTVQPPIGVIDIDIDGIVRGDEGEIKEVAVVDVDPDLVAARCTAVTAQTDAGGSEHPDNDFIVASGVTSAEIVDFEAVSGATVAMSGAITLGESITVSVRLGPDRVSSGGFVITLTCTPPGAAE
jgi:uncharacterized repeat protein (TIGR01451 family)